MYILFYGDEQSVLEYGNGRALRSA